MIDTDTLNRKCTFIECFNAMRARLKYMFKMNCHNFLLKGV